LKIGIGCYCSVPLPYPAVTTVTGGKKNPGPTHMGGDGSALSCWDGIDWSALCDAGTASYWHVLSNEASLQRTQTARPAAHASAVALPLSPLRRSGSGLRPCSIICARVPTTHGASQKGVRKLSSFLQLRRRLGARGGRAEPGFKNRGCHDKNRTNFHVT
jgi:hypothetical protein